MKIGELARRGGINASAIRYYEKLGLLSPPHRSGGQRRYSPEALDRVLLIRFAGEMGFSLPEIKLFLSGLRGDTPVGPRWKKLATKKLAEVEDRIARSLRLKMLLQNLLHCRCASLQQCVRALSLSGDLQKFVSRPDPSFKTPRAKRVQRKPGSMKGKITLGPEFFEPLVEYELKRWN